MTSPALEEIAIPFESIATISQHNPRRDRTDGSVEAMKASIRDKGMLDKLVVHRDPNDSQIFHVLKGGTRWLALRGIIEESPELANPFGLISVLVADGDDQRLADLALTLDVIRTDLHPVDQYEGFARLGFDAARIAKTYGISLRQAQQRLKLGELAPEIRAAWRAGRIDGKQAEAFAAAGDVAAQARLLEELAAPTKPVTRSPAEIRKLATEGSMPAASPEALFVGASAYRDAGGIVDEDLFFDEVRFRDGTLLRKLAAQKLSALASVLREKEGWGFCIIDDEKYRPGSFELSPTLADAKRQEKLALQIEAATDRDELARLIAEQDDIESKLYRRSLALAQRAKLGICVTLDAEGFPSIERGLERATPAKPAAPIEPEPPAKPKKKAIEHKAPEPQNRAPEGGNAFQDDAAEPLHMVLRGAINFAVADVLARRPDLAIVVAASVLSDVMNTEHVQDGLLSRLAFGLPSRLAVALAKAATLPLADLQSTFAHIVADMIDVGRIETMTIEALIRALRARGADLAAAIARALDYGAYFKAATKEASVQAIGECEGVEALVEADKLSKAKAQTRAAESAKAKGWLPLPLREWLQEPAVVDKSQWLTLPQPELTEAAE